MEERAKIIELKTEVFKFVIQKYEHEDLSIILGKFSEIMDKVLLDYPLSKVS